MLDTKHSGIFRIDVRNRKTERQISRESSRSGLDTKKAEIHNKLREISQECSKSTNIDSKGSSGTDSLNDCSTVKFQWFKITQKANKEIISKISTKNEKMFRYIRRTRNKELR